MRYTIGTGMTITPGARNLAALIGRRVSRPAEGGGMSGTGCSCHGTGNIPVGVSGEFTDAAKWGAGWVVGGVAALWLLSKVVGH
jgi:hypothetical protein